ncbi:MAG: copper chaperone PCu(A)C [Myxococcota bacterium]|nr:copper chaperone PCu(A)C [Myxococcota bacterium]
MRSIFLAACLCLVVPWSGAARAGELEVRGAWVRLPPPGASAAGYLELHNRGAAPLRVVGVSSPAAERVEMHRTVVENDVARMRPVKEIEVPAGGKVVLEPGGLHLMLIGPQGLREGGELALTLTLEGGATLAATAEVKRHRAGHGHAPHH